MNNTRLTACSIIVHISCNNYKFTDPILNCNSMFYKVIRQCHNQLYNSIFHDRLFNSKRLLTDERYSMLDLDTY